MGSTDQPFLEPDAAAKYGLRTKSISQYRFMPWGRILAWAGAALAVTVAAAWALSQYM